MKLFVYDCRSDLERSFYEKYAKEFGLEVTVTSKIPDMTNVHMAAGHDYVNTMISTVSKEMIEAWKALGVKMISTRTIGYDHFDLEAAVDNGMHLGNSDYPPDAVAEFTLMLILMTCKNAKTMMKKVDNNDYTITHEPSTNLSEKVVGIIGTGKIGKSTIQKIHPMCKEIMMYDKFINDDVLPFGTYTDLDTLFKTCDVISLHVPSFPETKHIVNKARLAMMKPGSVVINTARGDLIDTKALIEALEQGQIAGAGLDVVEGERGIVFNDLSLVGIKNHDLSVLKHMPNVIFMPHAAYYTSTSIESMIKNSVKTLVLPKNAAENPWLIV